MKKNDYKVLVRCMTFNHFHFIKAAMEGFCIQETNFPFICVIVDDASTDNTANAIKEYFEENFELQKGIKSEETDDYKMYFSRHKKNRNCYFVVYFLKYNHYGRKDKKEYVSRWGRDIAYEAMCEGDDFWIDPYKIQKEFDYLESHQDKSLVYTDCNVYFNDEQILHENVLKTKFFKPTIGYKDFLIEGKYLVPCSWFYRKAIKEAITIPTFSTDGTLCIAFVMLVNNMVGYINDTTCTYRVVHGSASHSNDIRRKYNYIKGAFVTERYYLQLYKHLFDERDIVYLYNRRYSSMIAFAIALNDKEIIREIKQFKSLNISFKLKFMLKMSRLKIFRKLLLLKIKKSIQKGL